MVNFVKMSSSDSWTAEICPYTLPTEYRPKLEIHSALITDNGYSITSIVTVHATGRIEIQNRGGSGTKEARNGFICFPV